MIIIPKCSSNWWNWKLYVSTSWKLCGSIPQMSLAYPIYYNYCNSGQCLNTRTVWKFWKKRWQLYTHFANNKKTQKSQIFSYRINYKSISKFVYRYLRKTRSIKLKTRANTFKSCKISARTSSQTLSDAALWSWSVTCRSTVTVSWPWSLYSVSQN
jgi:hypothetical protein